MPNDIGTAKIQRFFLTERMSVKKISRTEDGDTKDGALVQAYPCFREERKDNL